jgi:hypothetical protein
MLATYAVTVELVGFEGSRTTEVLELRGRSAWDVVAGVRPYLREAPWCSAFGFYVRGVEGPGAAELPEVVGLALL